MDCVPIKCDYLDLVCLIHRHKPSREAINYCAVPQPHEMSPLKKLALKLKNELNFHRNLKW